LNSLKQQFATQKIARTWILKTQYPGSPHPTRRALGGYSAMSLERAREKAGRWRTLIKQGIDPAVAEERERQESIRQQATTCAMDMRARTQQPNIWQFMPAANTANAAAEL
jgi:hypothetical protein